MSIEFVGRSAFSINTNALTVGAVPGVQSGDIVFLIVETANQPIATPAGWTPVPGGPLGTGAAGIAGGVALYAYYKIATGADTTTNVNDSGNHTSGMKVAYRGIDTASPIVSSEWAVGDDTVGVSDMITPNYTTDNRLLFLAALDRDFTASSAENAMLYYYDVDYGYYNAGALGSNAYIETKNTQAGGGVAFFDFLAGNPTRSYDSFSCSALYGVCVFAQLLLRAASTGPAGVNLKQPNASATGSVSQTHNLTGAESTARVSASTGAATSLHTLTASSVTQSASAATGAVQMLEMHTLSGAGVAQPATASTGAVQSIVEYVLAGAAVAQSGSASTGAVVQTRTLTAQPVTQPGKASAGAASQVHMLTGAAGAQSSAAATGAVTHTHVLTAGGGTQSASSSTGSASQAHALSGASAVQPALASASGVLAINETALQGNSAAQPGAVSTGAISQHHQMAAQGAAASAAASAGSIVHTHVLMAAPVAADAVSASSAIAQQHILAAGGMASIVKLSTGAVGSDAVLHGLPVAQATKADAGTISVTHVLAGDDVASNGIITLGDVLQAHALAAENAVQPAETRFLVEYIDPKCTGYTIVQEAHGLDISVDAMTATAYDPHRASVTQDAMAHADTSDKHTASIQLCKF